MIDHFGNALYKIKCVISALNTFCPESAGSVEDMNIEEIDSYIEFLQDAKRSLIKGKEQGDGITLTEANPSSFRPTISCAPVYCSCTGGCLEADDFLQNNAQKLSNGVHCQIKSKTSK